MDFPVRSMKSRNVTRIQSLDQSVSFCSNCSFPFWNNDTEIQPDSEVAKAVFNICDNNFVFHVWDVPNILLGSNFVVKYILYNIRYYGSLNYPNIGFETTDFSVHRRHRVFLDSNGNENYG